MPAAPPTEPTAFLSAPGESVLGYQHRLISPNPDELIPRTFIDAMSVRHAVFVQEQHVPEENEVDTDDARSFHWVAYASAANVVKDIGGRKGTETTRLPIATVRLVPPPHSPYPVPNGTSRRSGRGQQEGHQPMETGPKPTKWHDGKEPYAKLGRLATLPAYRGLGLARFIIGCAFEWASKHPLSIVPLPSATSTEAAKVWGGLGNKQEWKGLVLAHAQKDAEAVWRKFGFERDDSMGIWFEEGIEHVGMWRRIPVQEEKYVFR